MQLLRVNIDGAGVQQQMSALRHLTHADEQEEQAGGGLVLHQCR